MLAFSLLDSIIAVDWQHRWLNYLNLKGYLKHMVEGLAHEDHMLQSMLDPSPEPLKVIFLLWTLNWKCFYANNMTCAVSFSKAFGFCQAKMFPKTWVFWFLAKWLHFRWAGDRILSYHRELWESITEKTSSSSQVVVAVIKKLVHTLSCVNIELRKFREHSRS